MTWIFSEAALVCKLGVTNTIQKLLKLKYRINFRRPIMFLWFAVNKIKHKTMCYVQTSKLAKCQPPKEFIDIFQDSVCVGGGSYLINGVHFFKWAI